MWLNTNRLSLNNMVEKHMTVPLTVTPHKTITPLYVMGRGSPVAREPVVHGNDIAENSDTKDVKVTQSDIQFSVNTIMAQVHSTMKTPIIKPPRSVPVPVFSDQAGKPAEPEKKETTVVEVIPATQPNFVKQQKLNKSNNMHNNSNKRKTNTNCKTNMPSSIPQVKAKWQQKCQLKMRRSVGSPGDYNFTNQMRVNEILRQKKILVEMLEEHEKLQRDRQNIAREINVMRTYLNDIRSKLDFSIKKLNNQPTICDTFSKIPMPTFKPKRSASPKKVIHVKKSILKK